jgi:hypothetical protein
MEFSIGVEVREQLKMMIFFYCQYFNILQQYWYGFWPPDKCEKYRSDFYHWSLI